MIWMWNIPNTWPDKRIGTVNEETGTDRFEFLNGNVLDKNEIVSPDIVFECQEKFLYDVLPNSGSLLIISERLLNIMKNLCEDDFQVFKANVFVKNKKIDGYYLINIVNKIEVLDKQNSIYTTILDTDAILNLKKVVYKQDNLLNHHIVRNLDCLSNVLVSEKLKEIFDKEKIKGVEFRLEE